MKYLAAVILLLAACSKPPAVPEPPKAQPKAITDAPKFVELDAASLKEITLAVAPVVQRSIPLTIRANGRLTTNENTTWRVGAVTDGRIILADAKVGDRVAKGQVLAACTATTSTNRAPSTAKPSAISTASNPASNSPPASATASPASTP